jgi:hypothetical protein
LVYFVIGQELTLWVMHHFILVVIRLLWLIEIELEWMDGFLLTFVDVLAAVDCWVLEIVSEVESRLLLFVFFSLVIV